MGIFFRIDVDYKALTVIMPVIIFFLSCRCVLVCQPYALAKSGLLVGERNKAKSVTNTVPRLDSLRIIEAINYAVYMVWGCQKRIDS
jgi:hypothetical protein